jgi:hypothetical protein
MPSIGRIKLELDVGKVLSESERKIEVGKN